MIIKWRIFLLTFASYALIHAVRTSWSSLKYSLNSQPYGFSPVFLGALDMFVFLTLAVCLNTFGPKAVRQGPKKYLQYGLFGLSLIMTVLGLFLVFKITAGFPYAIIYPLVGVLSCVGWPTCIYILSLYFQKGIMFSVWNGCIQFGDFIGLLLAYVIVQKFQANPGVLLVSITGLFALMLLFNKKFLPQVDGSPGHELTPNVSPAQQYNQNFVEEKEGPTINNQKMEQSTNAQKKTLKTVNFLTVWKLPGVTGYILSFAFVKSVNAMISTWLVFYLTMIDMVEEAHIIAILWSISTFAGGILGAYINPKFNKKIFIAALAACAIFFVFLEELHLYPNQIEVIVLVIACGIIFGGPFTVMNTSIPLYLSEKTEIIKYPGAKAAIISAMEGYPLLFCGVSLLIVPAIGVIDLHWLACAYCVISAAILLYQEVREQKEQKKEDKLSKILRLKKGLSQPNIDSFRDKHLQWSANLQQQAVKRKRRSKRNKNAAENQGDHREVVTDRKVDCNQGELNEVQRIIIQNLFNKKKQLLSNNSSQKKQGVFIDQTNQIQDLIANERQVDPIPYQLDAELGIKLANQKHEEMQSDENFKEISDENDFQNIV